MASITPVRVLLLLAAAALALGFALTRYTLPDHEGPAYGDVKDLLEAALGGRQPAIPAPPPKLAIQPVPSDSLPFRHTASAPPPASPAAADWLRRAVATDPEAVHAWLGSAVLAVSTMQGDTIETVLWRVAFHPRCPLISRLTATSVGRAEGATRIVALRSNCPDPSR
jgi:hypothetical protein